MATGTIQIESSQETSWTALSGTGLSFRKIGNGLVEWSSAGYNAATTANTVFTFSKLIPVGYRPSIQQQGIVCLYGSSGYLTGSSTTINFATNGTITLAGCNVAGIGVAGMGVYRL